MAHNPSTNSTSLDIQSNNLTNIKGTPATQTITQSTISVDRTQLKRMNFVRGPNPNVKQDQKQPSEVDSQDQDKEYKLIFKGLQEAKLCVEDGNQIIEKRKKYFLELKQEFPKMLEDIKIDEAMQDSTQRMLRRKSDGNRDIFSEWSDKNMSNQQLLLEILVELLKLKASRRILFLYFKLQQQELVCAKKVKTLCNLWENDPRNFISQMKIEENFQHKSNSLYLKQLKKFNKNSNRYHLLNRLGKGGQGEVWLYFDEELKKTIVFKKYANDQSENYLNEKKILLKLKDANRCPPILSCDDENLTIQTEKGEVSLREYDDYLKKSDSEMYSQSELLYIFHWLVLSVDIFSKGFGIYHCDIKPDNIVLVRKTDQTYQIQLIDFGGSVYKWRNYPGCYTPAFMNKEVHTIQESDLSIDVCIQFELYCVARTICKLALKDVSTKKFQTEPFLKLIAEMNFCQNGEYIEISQILKGIALKNLKTCDQVFLRIFSIISNNQEEIADSIQDKNNLVSRIQQESLLAASNNMTSDYLLQQIKFYEEMDDKKKCIDIINILVSPMYKHAETFTEEQKLELMIKKIQFENKGKPIIAIQDIQNKFEQFGNEKETDLFKFFLMVSNSQQNPDLDIDEIVEKGTSILLAQGNTEQLDPSEIFNIEDILATLLENEGRYQEAIGFREYNFGIAQLLVHNQSNMNYLFTATTQLADCCEALGRKADALRYYKLALETESKKEDSKTIVDALQNIATFYSNNNAFEKAIELQIQVLGKQTINTPDYLISLSKFASIEFKQGLYKEALDKFEQSLEKLGEYYGSSNLNYRNALQEMSICQYNTCNINGAIDSTRKVENLLRIYFGQNKVFDVDCLLKLCDFYQRQSLFQEAMNCASESFMISKQFNVKNSLIKSKCLEKIGQLYYNTQKYDQAIIFFQTALSVKLHHYPLQAQNLINLPDQIEGFNLNLSKEICNLCWDLALAHDKLQNYDFSARVLKIRIECQEKEFKTEDHPQIGVSRGKLGMVLAQLRKFEESKVELAYAVKVLQPFSSNQDSSFSNKKEQNYVREYSHYHFECFYLLQSLLPKK